MQEPRNDTDYISIKMEEGLLYKVFQDGQLSMESMTDNYEKTKYTIFEERDTRNNKKIDTKIKNKSRKSNIIFKTKKNRLRRNLLKLKGGMARKQNNISVPALSSSLKRVNLLGNIWRSIGKDWSLFNAHPICNDAASCFLCAVRSLSTRTLFKKKNRDKIQPIEIEAFLDQFPDIENLSLKEIMDLSLTLIEKNDPYIIKCDTMCFECKKRK